jgi:hypothetical protein
MFAREKAKETGSRCRMTRRKRSLKRWWRTGQRW